MSNGKIHGSGGYLEKQMLSEANNKQKGWEIKQMLSDAKRWRVGVLLGFPKKNEYGWHVGNDILARHSTAEEAMDAAYDKVKPKGGKK
jgi:hypothetical protein